MLSMFFHRRYLDKDPTLAHLRQWSLTIKLCSKLRWLHTWTFSWHFWNIKKFWGKSCYFRNPKDNFVSTQILLEDSLKHLHFLPSRPTSSFTSKIKTRSSTGFSACRIWTTTAIPNPTSVKCTSSNRRNCSGPTPRMPWKTNYSPKPITELWTELMALGKRHCQIHNRSVRIRVHRVRQKISQQSKKAGEPWGGRWSSVEEDLELVQEPSEQWQKLHRHFWPKTTIR